MCILYTCVIIEVSTLHYCALLYFMINNRFEASINNIMSLTVFTIFCKLNKLKTSEMNIFLFLSKLLFVINVLDTCGITNKIIRGVIAKKKHLNLFRSQP